MILSTNEAAERLRAELGDKLASIQLRNHSRHDLSRAGIKRAALEAAQDPTCTLTMKTAPTATAAMAVHLAERIAGGTLQPMQAMFDDSGSVWGDAARFVMSLRPDLAGGVAGKIAMARRAEADEERVRLTAHNPAAATWNALVDRRAGELGLVRPTPSSPAADREAWSKMLTWLVSRYPKQAAAASGRTLDDEGKVDGFIRGVGDSVRALDFDEHGRLRRSPAA